MPLIAITRRIKPQLIDESPKRKKTSQGELVGGGGGRPPRAPLGPPVPCEHTALGSLWRGVAIAIFLLGFRVDQGKSLNCTYLDSFLVDQGKSLNCTHGVAASPPAQSVCQSARSRLPVSNHELKKTLHQVLAITRGVGWCGSLDDGAS